MDTIHLLHYWPKLVISSVSVWIKYEKQFSSISPAAKPPAQGGGAMNISIAPCELHSTSIRLHSTNSLCFIEDINSFGKENAATSGNLFKRKKC